MKVTVPDVPLPGESVTTLTGTERGAARSEAVIAARSWLALMNVVVREAPFQRTTDEATKPLPLTVSVRPALPATLAVGERLLATGPGETLLKVAVTVVAAFTVAAQVALPLHAPLHPAKIEPEAGLAVSVIGVPAATVFVQVVPHAIPAGELVTVPAPVPFFVTDSVTEPEPPPVVEPLTPRETVSPFAVKFTFAAKLPTVVGRNRTITARLPPGAREKEAPDTILNGAPTLAAPEMLALLALCTVKVRSTVPLTATLPKLVVADGATSKVGCATPLAELEHALSLPLMSTAVTRAKYVVPALRAVTRVENVCPDAGVVVGDDTAWNDGPGQVGSAVPRYIR